MKRLTDSQRDLVTSHMDLVRNLTRYFLQHRQPWQRSVLSPDLEGEGYLSLCRAARTYDPNRLPYPRAYFIRAVLNGMYRWMKRSEKMPRDLIVSMQEAEILAPVLESPDYLKLCIEEMSDLDREIATDRFIGGMTFSGIAEKHSLSSKAASAIARDLAHRIAHALETHLPPPAKDG